MRNLKGLVNEIKTNRNVMAVILFGSHAKKRATLVSDVDICVISSKMKEREKARIEALGNEKIDIVFFDELPLPIKFRVFKEGKFLYIRDERFVNSLKAKTISMFLDFKPILDTYFKKVYGWKYEI
jgi:predicted nucleotidyltransferase